MMDLDQKVNQLCMFGLNRNFIWPVGSIILFTKDIKDLSQLRRLTRKIHHASKIPPLISIDQEGGRVNRITSGVTVLPSLSLLGKINSPEAVYNCGRVLAWELRSLGIDLDLAPVVDVNTESKNPIIGDRSFGADYRQVTKLAVAMIEGMQRNGLSACAKHFPGHGPSKSDSHLYLPRVSISRVKWSKIHLQPFRAAIKLGVKSIMIGHLYCPALDNKYPASLSVKIITGLLKEKLGYKGLIITDDLAMGAITRHYCIGEAAVLAVAAGADMVIVGNGLRKQKVVQQALIKAFKNGRLSQKRLTESVSKILRLKKKVFGKSII